MVFLQSPRHGFPGWDAMSMSLSIYNRHECAQMVAVGRVGGKISQKVS